MGVLKGGELQEGEYRRDWREGEGRRPRLRRLAPLLLDPTSRHVGVFYLTPAAAATAAALLTIFQNRLHVSAARILRGFLVVGEG